MRYAIFSDVHAYPPALERVLADAESQGVDFRICLGDVVGYGPDPSGAVALCRERCDAVVAGNHDHAVADMVSTVFFIPRAKDAVARHRRQLPDADVDWLAELPMSFVREDFACAHGEFHRRFGRMEAGFGYVISDLDADYSLRALPPKTRLAFVGHTHAACVWRKCGDDLPKLLPPKDFVAEDGVRYVVNIGAVGYPRYHMKTYYAIYDSAAHEVSFRVLPFDFADYARRIDDAGIARPLWLEDALNPQRREEEP